MGSPVLKGWPILLPDPMEYAQKSKLSSWPGLMSFTGTKGDRSDGWFRAARSPQPGVAPLPFRALMRVRKADVASFLSSLISGGTLDLGVFISGAPLYCSHIKPGKCHSANVAKCPLEAEKRCSCQSSPCSQLSELPGKVLGTRSCFHAQAVVRASPGALHTFEHRSPEGCVNCSLAMPTELEQCRSECHFWPDLKRMCPWPWRIPREVSASPSTKRRRFVRGTPHSL